MADASSLLRSWLEDPWLDETCAALRDGGPERTFFMAISAAPRHVGKDPLDLDEARKQQADQTRPGWRPATWTRDQAARAALALSVPHEDADAYVATLSRAYENADVGEQVALYQALPLLPHPEAHRARCAEGIRTNMTAVFTAVAHENPYPKEQLAQDSWNQMVLKALFVGVALDPIDGLDERTNEDLMRMLCDYAHERWSAGRPVSPELWRCVGPHADDSALQDLARALQDADEKSRHAAVLALQSVPAPLQSKAEEILAAHPVTLPADLGWSDLA